MVSGGLQRHNGDVELQLLCGDAMLGCYAVPAVDLAHQAGAHLMRHDICSCTGLSCELQPHCRLPCLCTAIGCCSCHVEQHIAAKYNDPASRHCCC